ncbi:hypothetical protein BT69DRAFT_1264779 [Atractiella rhizophila]|nr:hypothetical protein BT69DRAFT_1264779 [Atractiella rhizophila]
MPFQRVTDTTAPDAYRTRDLYSHELQTLDIISRSPHPNICRYHGHVTDGTFVTGLCFEKHQISLWEAIYRNKRIDSTFVLEEVGKGLEHIHSIGFSHNDISPTNIMLDFDADGNLTAVVIIDFDSATKFWEKLVKPSWDGWLDGDAKVGDANNDWFGFGTVEKCLLAKPFFEGTPTREEQIILDEFTEIWCAGLPEGFEEYRQNFYNLKNKIRSEER